MRIALFTEVYSPFVNGVITHVKILKEGLTELGHEVLVVTSDASTRRHYIKDGVLHCPAANFKKIYNYSVSKPISRRRLKLLAEFKPDVIHIHNEFGIGLFGVFAAKILHVPLVHTLHTMYDEYIYYIAPSALTGAAKRIAYKYARFIANSAQVLTSPSSKSVHYFSLAGVHKPVHIIPNSVETDVFFPSAATEEEKAAIREKYSIPEDATVAIFVGRIGKEKSVDILLKYWKEQCDNSNLFLLVIGDGPYLDEYKELAASLNIKNVAFTGKIPHEKLPPYLCSGNVYISASLSEMHSISMLEGMASGLTVLQRQDPQNLDQIKSGVNGYLFETADEMGAKLREIAALEPSQKEELKQSVAASVAEHSGKEISEFILKIYRQAQDELKKETARKRFPKAEVVAYDNRDFSPPPELTSNVENVEEKLK